MEDSFNSSGFKALFGLGEDEKVRRSSISERLSKIDSNYFKEIYEQMYNRFSELYSKTEIEKYNLKESHYYLNEKMSGEFGKSIDLD